MHITVHDFRAIKKSTNARIRRDLYIKKKHIFFNRWIGRARRPGFPFCGWNLFDHKGKLLKSEAGPPLMQIYGSATDLNLCLTFSGMVLTDYYISESCMAHVHLKILLMKNRIYNMSEHYDKFHYQGENRKLMTFLKLKY